MRSPTTSMSVPKSTNLKSVHFMPNRGKRKWLQHVQIKKMLLENKLLLIENKKMLLMENLMQWRSSKNIAKEAIANMEALKDQPLAEGSALVSSAHVVSKVLPKNSSNIFLKNIGLQSTSLTKPPTTKERALQEQLVAEKHASVVLQDEANVLKQNFQNTEEALERTQMELQEYKKAMEENKKAVEENNLLLKRLLLFNCGGNVSGPSS